MRIIGRYKIVYSCGMIQYKNLISSVEFNNVVKPKQKRAELLFDKGFKKLSSILKSEIKDLYGSQFFTNNSPLYKASISGYLNLPEHQGGSKPCQVVIMKKKKYIRFTYNGGKIIDVKYKDYLKNIGYWSGVPAVQETIYK